MTLITRNEIHDAIADDQRKNKEMSISEVDHYLDSVTGLSWNRDSVDNTIIIRNVSLTDRCHCDLVCKFGLVDNLYEIHYRDSRQ